MKTGRVLVCLFLCACADVHLGDEYGKRTKATFQAQADATGSGDSMLDAEDARMILSRHRNKDQRATVSSGGTAVLVAPTPTAYGSGGGSMTSGGGSVVAPINLESTR